MFEVHTVKEEGGEEALGAGKGSGSVRQGRRGGGRLGEMLTECGGVQKS